MTRRPHRQSKTRSRCACGHVSGRDDPQSPWRHASPLPEHACRCTEPQPSPAITGTLVREGRQQVRCCIATLGDDMRRHESEAGL